MINPSINTSVKILKWMAKPQTDIESCQSGLILIQGSNPSKTTSRKIELIAQFLSANREQINQSGESQSLITALKEKLIREAEGDLDLIQKVKGLSPVKVDTTPEILIIKAPTPKTAEQFSRNMELFVKHYPDYMLGNHMEVIDISKGGTPKDWEPEKLLSSFRTEVAHFSSSLSSEQTAALEKTVAPLIKPVSVIKFGLVIESENQFANRAMFFIVHKLLVHQTPVIVNREFMMAWRQLLSSFQIPLQWYHQEGGELTLIIPESAGTPETLGFNEKELIRGTYKEILPLKTPGVDQALTRLLEKETSDRKFMRVGMVSGHGSEGTVAGLSLEDLSKVQHTLYSSGMLFETLLSCSSGGANLEKIEESPYPIMVCSSSEVSSKIGGLEPSYDGILEYAKSSLQRGKIGVLIPQTDSLTMDAFESDEGVRTIFNGLSERNTPTLIAPKATISLREGFKELHGLKRLQDKIVSQPIQFTEKDKGFISMGGTGYHLIKEVVAEKVSLETITTNTFGLLDLTESSTKKAIFIRKIRCPILKTDWLSGSYENVVLYASKEGSVALFSNPGFLRTSYHSIGIDQTGRSALRTVPENEALSLYYTFFASTVRSKGNEGLLELFEFQKQFFGKTASSSPLHEIYGFLIQASCDEQAEVSRGFQKLIQTLKEKGFKKELELARDFAQALKLGPYVDLATDALAPELIQKIRAGRDLETIEYFKNRIKQEPNSLLLLFEPDLKGQTPLYWAVHLNRRELIHFLIQQTAEISKKSQSTFWDRSAFFEACRLSHVEAAKEILNDKLDPETAAFAVKQALQGEKPEGMIQFLMEQIRFPTGDAGGAAFEPIISQLVEFGKHQLLELLLKNLTPKAIKSISIYVAISKKDIKSLDILLSSGVDPNTSFVLSPSQSLHPWIHLCQSSPSSEQIEMVKLLIKQGAKVDQELEVSGEIITPLTIATAHRNFPLIEVLMQNGATPEFGGRALLDQEVMKVMLENTPLEKLKPKEDSKFASPLPLALVEENYELAKEFIQRGVQQKESGLSVMSEYLNLTRSNAVIQVIEWILSHAELHKKPLEDQLFTYLLSAIAYSPLKVIQYLETVWEKRADHKNLEVKLDDLPSLSTHFGLPKDLTKETKTFLHALNRQATFNSLKNAFKLPQDQKPMAESFFGPEKEIQEVIEYSIHRIENFNGWNLTQTLTPFKSNPEVRKMILNAAIQKSPNASCQAFFSAMLEGNITKVKQCQLSNQDIVQIWNYLPPYLLLDPQKKPSEDLIRILFNQLEKAQLDKIDEAKRKDILKNMSLLCKHDADMQLRILSYGSMKDAFSLAIGYMEHFAKAFEGST